MDEDDDRLETAIDDDDLEEPEDEEMPELSGDQLKLLFMMSK